MPRRSEPHSRSVVLNGTPQAWSKRADACAHGGLIQGWDGAQASKGLYPKGHCDLDLQRFEGTPPMSLSCARRSAPGAASFFKRVCFSGPGLFYEASWHTENTIAEFGKSKDTPRHARTLTAVTWH